MGDGFIGEAWTGQAVEDLVEEGGTEDEQLERKSDMHIDPECHQGSGAITSFMAPSRSSIWGSKTVFHPNQQARTSPSTLGSPLFFMVLDHPQ
ncbi:hypothetical protein O181_005046 [Austropuccinia psidii MF-1]|uniref:Uncharacterized protein n=1 Tax=Austropuccinia psidii MF-1 TaxID=1389203 RepID=A0A9Q3BGL9_9BASI|nr:hypothetical protein [Austropuccinia psidii MF-1]